MKTNKVFKFLFKEFTKSLVLLTFFVGAIGVYAAVSQKPSSGSIEAGQPILASHMQWMYERINNLSSGCPSGQTIENIDGNGNLVCKKSIVSAECPAGQVIYGFDASGNVKCKVASPVNNYPVATKTIGGPSSSSIYTIDANHSGFHGGTGGKWHKYHIHSDASNGVQEVYTNDTGEEADILIFAEWNQDFVNNNRALCGAGCSPQEIIYYGAPGHTRVHLWGAEAGKYTGGTGCNWIANGAKVTDNFVYTGGKNDPDWGEVMELKLPPGGKLHINGNDCGFSDNLKIDHWFYIKLQD